MNNLEHFDIQSLKNCIKITFHLEAESKIAKLNARMTGHCTDETFHLFYSYSDLLEKYKIQHHIEKG